MVGHYDAIPEEKKLNLLWQDLSYSKQISNIYCAMHIGCKLRSVRNQTMTDEDVRILSAVEHNRWNVEKLLAGYEPLSHEERVARLESKDRGEQVEDLEPTHKHDCIAPFNDLNKKIQKYVEIIVKNMKDISNRE